MPKTLPFLAQPQKLAANLLLGLSCAIALAACDTATDTQQQVESETEPEVAQSQAPAETATEDEGAIAQGESQVDQPGDVTNPPQPSEKPAQLPLSQLEAQIQTSLKERLDLEVTAECGEEEFKAVEAGETFDCQIKDSNNKTGVVEVIINDEQGNVTWNLANSELVANAIRKRFIEGMEGRIEQNFEQTAGIAVESVACPADIEMGTGQVFECDVEAEDGGTVTVLVTQKDEQGNIEANITKGLISLNQLEAQMESSFQNQLNVAVDANCGDEKFKVAQQGDTFTCEVKDEEGNTGIVEIGVTDDQGNVSVRLQQLQRTQ